MTNTYTFPRSAFVGFDHLFNELNRVSLKEDTYPPHNIVFIDDDNFLVEIAVAGFSKENLDIQLKDSVLTVSGEMEDIRKLFREVACGEVDSLVRWVHSMLHKHLYCIDV